MPVNLDALIRYHTIDKCLKNRFKEWTWEDLAKSCFEALDEVLYRSEKNSISKRTIENDIRILKSDILGYKAPIICKKGLYSYTDKHYSIKNASLTQDDIRHIFLAVETLKQYKGFRFFDNLKNTFESLEHRVTTKLHEKLNKVIHFEDTYLPTETTFINPIIDAIQHQQVLKVTYQKFDSEIIKENILHPYLLKEFKNRWYVLGFNPNFDFLKTYALDRIKEVEIVKDQVYQVNKEIDAQSFFSNVVGVSNPTDQIQEISIIVKPAFANYIKTQPLHHSQIILKEDNNSLHIELKVVHNLELETLLCGYASFLIIQSPETLKTAIKERLKAALNNF